MLAYKRSLWVWILILAFAGLVTFAAYCAFFFYGGDRYLLYTKESPRGMYVGREMWEDWCLPRYIWQDVPDCPIEVRPPSMGDSLVRGTLVGLLSIAVGHWLARKAEERIEGLTKDVNDFDTGKITPSYRDEAEHRPDAQAR